MKEIKAANKDFFNCCLTAPLLTLGYSYGDRLTNLMLITTFNQFDLKVTRNLVMRLAP